MRRPYWDYYLTIEDDLITASRYVEFVEDNYCCYSVEFARILLVVCSELDMAFKVLCQTIDPSSKADKIKAYHPVITGKFKNFVNVKRYVRSFKLVLDPFKDWDGTKPPHWWTFGYNKIKHQRNVYFHHANLKNTLDATAALQIVLFHLYSLQERREDGGFAPADMPRLMVTYYPTDPDRESMTHSLSFVQ